MSRTTVSKSSESHRGSTPPAARSERIVFLLSSPRAGSTLVSRVLDSHSKIASPCEICLPYVVTGSWKFIKSLTTISKISNYFGARVPFPRLSLALPSVARRHLNSLVDAILQKDNKQTVVIKDPRHAAHVSKVESLFRGEPPRFVLLHRDARAVSHSFMSTLGRKPERGFKAWLECTQGMLKCQERHGDRCLSLRFEDFVAQPEDAARQIVAFLGHDFEESMLDYGSHDHADDHLGLWTNKRLIKSVKQGSIQNSKRPSWMDNSQMLALYEQLSDVRRINQQLGYESAPAGEAKAA